MLHKVSMVGDKLLEGVGVAIATLVQELSSLQRKHYHCGVSEIL